MKQSFTYKALALKHQAISALYIARQAKDELADNHLVTEYVRDARRLWTEAKTVNKRELRA